MAESFYAGNGFILDGKATGLSVGYPFIVGNLRSVHLASPSVLVALNVAALFGGVYLIYRILRENFEFDKIVCQLLAAAVLVSVHFVKYTALPQSELSYFFLSTLAIYLMQRVSPNRLQTIILISITALTVAAAIEVRAIGVSLLAPLLLTLACAVLTGRGINIDLRYRMWFYGAVCLVLAVITFTAGSYSSYWSQASFGHLIDLSLALPHLVH